METETTTHLKEGERRRGRQCTPLCSLAPCRVPQPEVYLLLPFSKFFRPTIRTSLPPSFSSSWVCGLVDQRDSSQPPTSRHSSHRADFLSGSACHPRCLVFASKASSNLRMAASSSTRHARKCCSPASGHQDTHRLQFVCLQMSFCLQMLREKDGCREITRQSQDISTTGVVCTCIRSTSSTSLTKTRRMQRH